MSAAARRSRGDYKVVVAIDFGTTHTGYAFSEKSTPQDIFCYTEWGVTAGIPYAYKAPTCVLTDSSNDFVAFGYEARNKYASLLPEDEGRYRLYNHFKMTLYRPDTDKPLSRDDVVRDVEGNTCPALDMFSMVLSYLNTHIRDQLKRRLTQTVADRDIRWVITVPAIWSDAAKQFMRTAVINSGLPGEADPSSVVVALEPEAASLYCKELSSADFASDDPVRLTPGDKYLTLDCGGGTLDITAHEIRDDGSVAELYQATGGPMGAAQIDQEFVDLLDVVLARPFTVRYKLSRPTDYQSMLNEFELEKRAFNPTQDAHVSVQVPYTLGEMFDKEYCEQIATSVQSHYAEQGVRFKGGHLFIPRDLVTKLFAKVTDKAIGFVKELLKRDEVRDVRKILMVGGFSDSPVLQQQIRAALGDQYTVLVPRDAGCVVLKGAVLFGHRPDTVIARRSKMTVGVAISMKYDPVKHKGRATHTVDGRKCVHDVFDVYVRRGEEVPHDKPVVRTHCPLTADQQAITYKVAATFREQPGYTDEAGVAEVGRLTVPLPGRGKDRKVETAMYFGGTEIEVTSRDPRPGGQTVSSQLDFLYR